MSRRKLAAVCLCTAVVIVLNIFIFRYLKPADITDSDISLTVRTEADVTDRFNVFYSRDGIFSERLTAVFEYQKANQEADARYSVLPLAYMRMDFGGVGGTVHISDITAEAYGRTVSLTEYFYSRDAVVETNDIADISIEDGRGMTVRTNDGDPYIVFYIRGQEMYAPFQEVLDKGNLAVKFILCILIDIIFLVGISKSDRLAEFVRSLYGSRKLMFSLAKNDFKTKFAGSYLGIIWAFIQPIVTVVVYWFVFEIGLRAGRQSDYPYILWLMAGLVPWFYFSEALNGGTNALIEYNYLVKKVVFNVSILPAVKVISALFVHLFFIAFVTILCWCYHYTPDLYLLQLIYYVICTFALLLGLSYLTSAVVVFFRDLSQIVTIVLQVGMWLTPIMYNAETTLSAGTNLIFKLNPMYYIVDGFRDALLGKVWFFDKMVWSLYFWIVIVALFGVGISVFKKLKVHFADVL